MRSKLERHGKKPSYCLNYVHQILYLLVSMQHWMRAATNLQKHWLVANTKSLAAYQPKKKNRNKINVDVSIYVVYKKNILKPPKNIKSGFVIP